VSPKLRFDLVLNNLVAWAYTSGVVLLKSDGLAWRPLVHIEDISQAFGAVLEAPPDLVHNAVFNVGANTENYQVRRLAEIVRQTVPGSRVEFEKGAGPDRQSYQVDFTKIRGTLRNYMPKWNARLGARQLHSAYKKLGLEGQEFEGPRLRRVDHLKQLLKYGKLDNKLRWKSNSK